ILLILLPVGFYGVSFIRAFELDEHKMGVICLVRKIYIEVTLFRNQFFVTIQGFVNINILLIPHIFTDHMLRTSDYISSHYLFVFYSCLYHNYNFFIFS
ncbi:hypothetical protein L9F63_010531, partial [Diploptera punctata]